MAGCSVPLDGFELKTVRAPAGPEPASYSPKMNAHVERFNRTLREKFPSYHGEPLMEPAAFNRKLIPWLLRYNGEGPHCREVLQLSKSGQRTICRVDRKRSKSRLFAILGFLPFRIPACIVPILSWNVLSIWTRSTKAWMRMIKGSNLFGLLPKRRLNSAIDLTEL